MRVSIMMVIWGTLAFAGHTCWADVQRIAPGTGQQDADVVDTGPNGLCETTAAVGDIQAAVVGQGTPDQAEIRCGTNKMAESTAAGDDDQRVTVGSSCGNPNTVVVDTGPDGIADSVAAGDDSQVIAFGTAPANTACVITGANGVADTAAAAGDDNLRLSPVGSAEPNTTVIRCGPNGVVDTAANNVNLSGDDVQLVPQGNACSTNNAVVDSGPDGVADTRAEGPELVLKAKTRRKVSIRRGTQTGTGTVSVVVRNLAFGPAAPAARAYRLSVDAGSCPKGVVSAIDADRITPGTQATASIPLGGKIKGSFVVQVGLEEVTTVSSKVPRRCTVEVTAIALDTDPDPDDAADDENNSMTVHIEAVDKNDL